MLPSLAARDVEEGLKSYVSNEFPLASKTFNTDGKSVLDSFLEEPHALTKGPWVEVKLPFRQAVDAFAVPFTHLEIPVIQAAQGFPFNPYEHQRLAFNRLQWQEPQSTIVATGTGSGKTECFLYPILDYCIANKKKGIKAIIIYPMNALASDQAFRLARLIHHINSSNKGRKLTAGIYTGDNDTKSSAMGPNKLISDRNTLRRFPPDILLTNYRMLDFLLMRPEDQPLWEGNGKDVLRYLVVDELHTFDGAQGTDLACLIRRLRSRLHLEDSLVCVGTSATIGGESSIGSLCSYASAVFATDIHPDGVIQEDRLQPVEYLNSFGEDAPVGMWPGKEIAQIRKSSNSLRNYLSQALRLWFNGNDFGFSAGEDVSESRVALGQALPNLAAFRRFVQEAKGVTDIFELAEHWEGAIAELKDIAATKAERIACICEIIDSLVAMIAEARIKKVDTVEKEGKTVEKVTYLPFLNVRSQLWIRELARAVVSVSRKPKMALANDLQSLTNPLYLPVVGCRECSRIAWGSFIHGGTKTSGIKVQPDLKKFYEGWFHYHQDTQLFYPVEDLKFLKDHKAEIFLLCPQCQELQYVGYFKGNEKELENFYNNPPACTTCGCEDNVLVWNPDMTRDRQRRDGTRTTVLENRCPHCLSRGALRIFGAADSSLIASMLAHVHASNFNEDDRVIAFSDSVQDAALRAGFLSSRSYLSVVRHAIVNYLSHSAKDVSRILTDVLTGLPQFWFEEFKRSFADEPAKDAETYAKAAFIATFIAPDQQGHKAWQPFSEAASLGKASILAKAGDWEVLYGYVVERLVWQALIELGYWSGNGRTVQRVGAVSIYPNLEDLDRAVSDLQGRLEGFEFGRGINRDTIRHFLFGILEEMRQDGAFSPEKLGSHIKADFGQFLGDGKDWVFNQSQVMPTYGTLFPPPTGVSPTTPKRRKFSSVLLPSSKREKSWYKAWAQKLLTHETVFDDYLGDVFKQAMQSLEKVGVVSWIPSTNMADEGVWVTDPSRWFVSSHVVRFTCQKCRRFYNVAYDSGEWWTNMPCRSPGCDGRLIPEFGSKNKAFYYDSPPVRINAEEHTALVDGDTRKRIENSFKNVGSRWDVNLLSATPTLEMGIDIGNLSTVMQCSMPPNQASYLQRIGRAGRRDGNALALTMADRGQHSQYFWADPREMLDGEVSTPGVFLRAVAVLERQVMAFAIDRWVQSQTPPPKFPRNLGDALNQLLENDPKRFPNNLLEWITVEGETLYTAFMAMLDGPGGVTLPDEARVSLHHFVIGVEEEGRPSLTRRIRLCLEHAQEQREHYRHKRDELTNRLNKLNNQPSDDKVENEKEAIVQQRKAITKLISDEINRKNVFNFFTDEGLLPNYAFPEEGVTVNSVIIKRRTRDEIKAGVKAEPVKFSFERAAAAAIGELSPDSTFYVHSHRMHVDQVRLKTDSVEEWRLCDKCAHMERIDPTAPVAPVCPHCQSNQWSDSGRVRQMLRLREVIAHADSRYDRIRDDQESRPPLGQIREVLISFPPASEADQAWKIDDADFSFGFEYLKRITVREVNFGSLTLAGFADPLMVAGKELPRQGFKICKGCGMVYRENLRKGENLHDITCKFRDLSEEKLAKLDESPWVDGLFLFREIESEAIRIRIPVSDVIDEMGAELGIKSLIAAISLGLRKHFKGAVDHLCISQQDEPIPGSEDGRNHYLVIYDSVPGGSGYLKDLARKDEKTGKPEELREMFREAYESVANCVCANDESKDGCYQCVYQFRDGSSRDSISRLEAERLMARIASYPPEKYLPVETLKTLPSTSQSVLEQLFVKRLKSIKDINITLHPLKDGREAYEVDVPVSEQEQKLWESVLGRRIGDRLTWQLLTQVDVTAKEGADYPSRPDFTFKPMLGSVIENHPELVGHVFTDGWQYHAGIIADDCQKRQSILNLGHRVWSLSWADLKEPEDNQAPANVSGLVSNADYERAKKGWEPTFAGRFNPPIKNPAFGEAAAQDLAQQPKGSFAWLLGWLKGPLTFARTMQAGVQFAGLTQKPTLKKDPNAQEQLKIPSPLLNLGAGLLFKQYRLPTKDLGFNLAWQIQGISKTPRIVKLAAAIRIGEGPYADPMALKDMKRQLIWQNFLQYANVLQFADRFFVCTDGNEKNICYTDDATIVQAQPAQPAGQVEVMDEGWLEVMEDLKNDGEFFTNIIPSVNKVREAIVEAPELGIDGYAEHVFSEPTGLYWQVGKKAIYLFAEADLIDGLPENTDKDIVVLLDTMPDWLDRLKTLLTVKGDK